MVRVLLIGIFLFFNSAIYANIAKVVAYKGEAQVLRNNIALDVFVNISLENKDEIKTKNNTKVQLLFKDETIITIGKNSHFKIDDYSFKNTKESSLAKFSFVEGSFRTITGAIGKIAPDNFRIQTKTSAIGIRGTQILNEIGPKKERIYCTEGIIEIVSLSTNEKIVLNAGEFIEVDNLDNKPMIKKIDNKNSVIVDTNTKFNLKDDANFDEIMNFYEIMNFDESSESSIPDNINDREMIDDKIDEVNDIQNDKLKDSFIKEDQDIEPAPEEVEEEENEEEQENG